MTGIGGDVDGLYEITNKWVHNRGIYKKGGNRKTLVSFKIYICNSWGGGKVRSENLQLHIGINCTIL